MPPAFPPTHSWVCPVWRWLNLRITSPGYTIFDSAVASRFATTTMVYAANAHSTPISLHVDCYLADGTLETGVRVAGVVAPRQRFEASLMPTRAPTTDANGDFRESGAGWFQLWANGAVTPAAVFTTILGRDAIEIVMPLRPVELEEVVVEVAPPLVTTTLADEGGAAEQTLEANLSLSDTIAWVESVHAGRPFHREPGSGSR